jgi:FMN phosphatase YigB (HAD superfamily)
LVAELYERCAGLEWAPFPDTTNLRGLGVPAGVISNWDTRLRQQLDRIEGVEFVRVLGSAELGIRKPDPALYRAALDGLDHAPAEVVYVGDSPRLDIEPALAAGMTPVLVDRDDLYGAYTGHRIAGLDELGPLLARLGHC